MSSKSEPDRELGEFRRFVDTYLPGGASHISDLELEHLRDLVETDRHPEVVLGLIREMDTLLEADDTPLKAWMAGSAASGIVFDSPAQARAYLQRFRAILARTRDNAS
jgi:hypothetical protein